MARLLGRDLDELVGLHVHDVFDEQGRRDFDAHLAGMLVSGAGAENLEAYFIRPDGTAVWGLISYTPVHDDDGTRMGWLHRVTPYTERKELVEALVEREQQLATAQQIAHIGSWAWDVGGRPGAVVGRDVPHLRRRARHRRPTSRPTCRCCTPTTASAPARSSGRPPSRVPASTSSTTGCSSPTASVRWVRGRGVVERAPDGEVVRMSGTTQDITDLRNADEQAEEATRRLFLLQQMAMAANRATSLREALLMAGAGVPEHTTWAAVCAYLYDVPGDEPELLDIGRQPRSASSPTPRWPRPRATDGRGRRSGRRRCWRARTRWSRCRSSSATRSSAWSS